MCRKVHRDKYTLDANGINSLPHQEIVAILRAADDLIMSGGRSLLVKILKGSKAKNILEHGFHKNPFYGYYAHITGDEVLARVDWTIINEYLRIEYDYRLPMLVYTDKGWEIERETYAGELLQDFDDMLDKGNGPYLMSYLKDRSRDLILLLLDKVEETGNKKYIPLLEAWAAIDYKKVRARINKVINNLNKQ